MKGRPWAVGITGDRTTYVEDDRTRYGNGIKRWARYRTCNWLCLIKSFVCCRVSIGEFIHFFEHFDAIGLARWEDPLSSKQISISIWNSFTVQLLSIYLIRWRAFEGTLRNWRDTSVRVLSSTCGATMKVITMFSRSRTRCDARAQKGLMCPVGYKWAILDQKSILAFSPQNVKGESRKWEMFVDDIGNPLQNEGRL